MAVYDTMEWVCRQAGVVSDLSPLTKMDALDSVIESHHHYDLGSRLEPTTDLFSSLDLGFLVLVGRHRSELRADYLRIRELETRVTTDSERGSPA